MGFWSLIIWQKFVIAKSVDYLTLMPNRDYKGREINKDASTWDDIAKAHVCCNRKNSREHYKKCGDIDFDVHNPEGALIEKRIPMLIRGKAKENLCKNNHVFFSISDEIPCPYCSGKTRRLRNYTDPHESLKRR